MFPLILRPSESAECYTEERCHILEIWNDRHYGHFSIARARVAPGVTTVLHTLTDTDEIYYIVAGEGRMEVAGQVLGTVGPGDAVTIPAGATQRIMNTGPEDLLFLCVCAPRFRPENYREIREA